MTPLNNVDVIILIGFGISILVAFIRGFVKETLSILGLALFVVLVVQLSPLCMPWMSKYISSQILAQIVIFLIIMAVFYTIWIISTDKLITKIRTSTLSFMDRLFGLIFGFLRMLLILGFCFLIVKSTLPEELEKGPLKEAKFFVLAEASSDAIDKVLPKNFIEDAFKPFKEANKVETQKEKKSEKTKEDKKEEAKGLPTKVDQQQMDKMFEQLVKPEIKTENSKSKEEPKKEESGGYDKKEINNLDRLIDITTQN